VVRRYLEYCGYKVTYVQNVTDVDDKIINKSQITNPKSQTNPKFKIQIKQQCAAVVDRYLNSYFEVMDKLNVRRADKYPRATEHIDDMIAAIKILVEKEYAYTVDAGGTEGESVAPAAAGKAYDVYFEVAKFKDYLKLSKRKLGDMEAGARVAVDERKKSPHDFALWKAAKEGEPSWSSPWGAGRPGWHIECSVMSVKYLGQPFDIHGGGCDLIFPHHENEIAQAEAATGKPFARYWMHNGFVNVNKQKMSKSLGNFFTLKDIFEKYDPMVVRCFLLKTHYRGPVDFADEQLKEAGAALSTIVNARDNYAVAGASLAKASAAGVSAAGNQTAAEVALLRQKFKAAMDDDFNTAEALAVVFEIAHLMNTQVSAKQFDPALLDLLAELLEVLGLRLAKNIPAEDLKLAAEIDAARREKNYALADQKRKILIDKGYSVKTTVSGTVLS
jgi:cysteinyl-tRNA synthetase